jgi:hypothetical protein
MSTQTLGPRQTSRGARAVLLTLAVVVCAEGAVAILCRDNDFLWHRWVGEAFRNGVPYGEGLNYSYPVGRSLMDAVLAVGPYRLTRAVSFGLALLALYACYRTWRRLAGDALFAPDDVSRKAALVTGLVFLPYLLRDLDECGLQLFLLFFLTTAASAVVAGRHVRAGFWLGTAITYKATPVLFVPFLLWKRQWRAAGWAVGFTALWAAALVPFVGLEKTVQAHRNWLTHFQRLRANRQAYPDPLVEPQRVENLALPALLARNLETYPPGHPLYLEHPLFFQPGEMSPESAFQAVRGIVLVLALLLARRFRRPWGEPALAGRLAPEWATVCALCALVSPMCWTQHLVLALPALFLVARATLAARPVRRWRLAALAALGVVICLTKDGIVGREMAAVLLSYKVDTLAVLTVLGLLLSLPAVAVSAGLVTRSATVRVYGERRSVALPQAAHASR